MSIVYPTDSKKANPPFLYPDYKSTVRRAPVKPLIVVPHTLSELTGPVYGHEAVRETDARSDASSMPVSRSASASSCTAACSMKTAAACRTRWSKSGRRTPAAATRMSNDQHPAPLDPNFTGSGRVVTDAKGHYKFMTIKPGAYPWPNGPNSWRPAHIHLSLFGTAFTSRLVTQMYFPGDPLFALDPIAQSVPEFARNRLISSFDLEETVPDWALAYKFDIVLRGRNATPEDTD